jgi:hypothetical protein
VQGDHTVGLNLGGQWTDGTGMTENGICIDGRLTKIGADLRFAYDRPDLMAPWSIQTPDSRLVDLRFTPVYERVSKGGTPAYSSEVHQLFGSYDGRISDDCGVSYELTQLFGWIEDHTARW